MRIPLIVLALALAVTPIAVPQAASAQNYTGLVGQIVALLAPPQIPYYQQPVLNDPNDIWQPGYWASSPSGYYWVPGEWVQPPQPGLLWTPGYWAYNNNQYDWQPGYWANQVGYYGGVNYGNGYYGNGYDGGSWQGRTFRYNTAVSRVNRTYVRNYYYSRTTIVNNSHVSYNGGPGGLRARPSRQEQNVGRSHHYGMTQIQTQHMDAARANRSNWASVNHGRPSQAVIVRQAAPQRAPQQHAAPQRAPQQHAAPQRAPQQHAAPQRAPQQHAAPQQRAPHPSHTSRPNVT